MLVLRQKKKSYDHSYFLLKKFKKKLLKLIDNEQVTKSLPSP